MQKDTDKSDQAFRELVRVLEDAIRAGTDSVGLTLESLLTRVVLPEKDQPIFVRMMQENLGLSSAQEPIASHL